MSERTGYPMFLVFVFYLGFLAGTVCGDGFVVRQKPVGEETSVIDTVVEVGQRVVLYFDSVAKRERLVLEVELTSLSGDYAWVIPLPEWQGEGQLLHDVQEIRDCAAGFKALHLQMAPQITIVQHQYVREYRPYGFFGCSLEEQHEKMGEEEGPLFLPAVVLAEGQTESFQYQLVDIPYSSDLASWTLENGYGLIPSDALDVIQRYIDDRHVFLIVQAKEREVAIKAATLVVDFHTQSPFFPLEISRIGASEEMNLILYVLSDRVLLPIEWTNCSFDLTLSSTFDILGSPDELQISPQDWYPEYDYRQLYHDSFAQDVDDVIRLFRRMTDGFLRTGSRSIDVSNRSETDGEIIDSFLSGLQLPASLNLSRLERLYSAPEELEDILLLEPPHIMLYPYQPEDFLGSYRIHVKVIEQGKEAYGDASLMFPLFAIIAFRLGAHRERKRNRASLEKEAC